MFKYKIFRKPTVKLNDNHYPIIVGYIIYYTYKQVNSLMTKSNSNILAPIFI